MNVLFINGTKMLTLGGPTQHCVMLGLLTAIMIKLYMYDKIKCKLVKFP